MIEFLETKKITGIIAINDTVGKQTVNLIQQAGKRIPEDYSIIINNYTELNHSTTLKITGIKTPWQEIAFKGTELLLSMIAGKSTDWKPVCKVITPNVIEGDSIKTI
jgi:DNA-binding LacI/PurR family transcriptional regulator